MTRVYVQAVETKGADGEVFIRNTTHTDGGYYTASTAFTGTAGGGGVALSAGTQSVATGTVAFANSHGITFGMSGSSQITASHNGLTSQSQQAFSAIGGASQFQTLSFSNANGFSFSNSLGQVVGSYTVPSTAGLLSALGVSAGTTNTQASALSFDNGGGGGVSFLLAGATLSASHNGITSQSNQQGSIRASGNTIATNSVSATYNASSIVFQASGIASAGVTNGSVIFSVPGARLSAGTTNVIDATAISYGNANGVSFGLNGSTVTASHNGLTTQTNQTGNLSATGNTLGTNSVSATYNASGVIFAGSGVASVGVSNGSVVISVPAGGGGITAVNLSAGTTSNNLTAFTLSNSNNVSFGLNGSVVTASASVATSLSNINVSAGTTSQNLSAVTFSNLNGVSFGLNGSVITGSVATALTSQSNQAVSAGNGSFTFQTLSLANSNGVSFSTGTQGVFASHNGLTSQSNQAFSAPGGSSTFQTLSFSNNANVSWTNTNGQVAASAWIQIEGGTQGGPGTIISFANGSGVTFGNDNGTITASVNAGGGAGATVSAWPNYPQGWATSSTWAAGIGIAAPTTNVTYSVAIAPLILPVAVAYNEPRILASMATAAGTGSLSAQHAVGIYTRNGATLSLSTSYVWNIRVSQNSVTAQTVNWFFGTNSTVNSSQVSGNVSASFTGIRGLTLTNAAHTLSAGHYFIATAGTRSTTGLNVMPMSIGNVSASQQTIGGARFGTAATNPYLEPFLAYASAQTRSFVNASDHWLANMPASIATSALVRGTATRLRWPYVLFNSTG